MSGSLTKGTAILGVQQVVTFASMMVLHVATGRYFGPEVYGLFSVVHAVLTLLVFTFLTGVPHAVSRFTAENRDAARSIVRWGLVLQAAIGIAIGFALGFGASRLGHVLANPSLTPLFRIAAWAFPFVGVSLAYVHALNGLHRFERQAIGLGSMTLLKVAGVLTFLALGAGPVGAMRGLVLAAVAACALIVLLGRGVGGTAAFPFGRLARYGFQLCATYLAVAVWEQIDLLILESVGTVREDPGLFTAAAAITAAPESIFFPLILTLFPAISRSTAAGATGDVAWYLSKSLGYAFRLLCPLAVGSFFLGNDLLGLFYGTEYLRAAFAIGPLVVAILFYTLYELMDTYLRASGRGSLSLAIAGVLLVAHVGLDLLLVPRWQLAGTIVTMVVSSVLAAGLVAIPVLRTLPVRPRALSILRVILASAIAFAPLAFWDPGDGKESVIASIPLLIVYFALLFALREIDGSDVVRLRTLVRALRPRN